MSDLQDNLSHVLERIARATERSGRDASAVRLVAVTKTLPVQRIKDAIEAGVADFGENRVQEALGKYAPVSGMAGDALMGRDGIHLHLIGTLQRNKAKAALSVFDTVQSVDRVDLVQALDKAAVAQSRKRLPVLLQVNVTGEVTKSGAAPKGLPALAEALLACSNLEGRGLMTIARFGAGETELRRTFSQLRTLLERLNSMNGTTWHELSMGMSDDYEIAIQEGATMVRLGRALFGERQ